MQTKKENRKNAEVSITGILPKEAIAGEVERTLAHIQREIELPGFRKGKAPIEKVRSEVGEKALWKESAEFAIKKELEGILKEHEVLPIMPVGASLKASDINTDVPFEIIAIVAPSCSIGNYKEVAEKGAAKVPRTDETKEKELAFAALKTQARAMAQSTESGEMTDEEAKKLGFENGKAAEHFITEEAARAVKERELQKKRAAIAEALIEAASCDIPRVMILEEARALLEATKKDVARHETPWNEYLSKIGKTEETVQQELDVPAEKRVALDLIFGEIARTEKLAPSHEDEERLVKTLLAQGVPEESAKQYVAAVMLREKVWEVLGAKSNSAV